MKFVRVVALAALCAPTILLAQEFRGSIGGNVVDSTGALVPNVQIVAKEVQTGVESRTVSNSQSNYSIPFLRPGTYRITATAQGFKRYETAPFPVDVNAHVVINIQLAVGSASQTVQVSSQVPLLETNNSAVGQVVTMHQVADLPQNGRVAIMFAQLAAGVSPNPTGSGTSGFVHPYDTGTPAEFSAGGAPSTANELLLDGTPDGTWNNNIAYNPPMDAVQSVSMQVFEPDASFGRAGGATANVITKSGTNSFHGAAFEANQVSALAANSYFLDRAGKPKPALIWNQYGVSAGGPVWVPKVFDGRNKIFWFFAWEGIRAMQPANLTTSVPTAAERNGDFSALLALGSKYQIYNPFSGTASGSQVRRQPFANNVIPTGLLNPIAQNYLNFYPAPNATGKPDGTNNFVIGISKPTAMDNFFGRMDFNVSNRDKLFWDVRRSNSTTTSNSYFHNVATGLINNRPTWGSTLDNVFTLNPTTVVDTRFGWQRFTQNYIPLSANAKFDPTTLGFPSYMASSSNYLQMPAIKFNGNFYQLNDNYNNSTAQPSDAFQIFADVVKVLGAHTFKTGVDLRKYVVSNFQAQASTGLFTFDSSWTNGPFSTSGAAPIGQELAAFLVGTPTTGSYNVQTAATAHQKYFAAFVQDNWKVRNNFTATFGLRFEHETPTTERFNRSVNGFDTATPSPIAAAAEAAYAANPIPQVPASQFKVLGGLTFPSSSHPNLYNTESWIFSPRVGFAWTPQFLSGKTVLRGGAGVFVFPIGIQSGNALNQEGFSQTTAMDVTDNNFLSPANTLSNPFPNGIQKASGSALGLGTFMGQGVTFFNPRVRNPYSIRWSMGIQQQLPGNALFAITYIGSHAVHLPVANSSVTSGTTLSPNTQLNFVPAEFLSTSPTRDQAVINTLSASVANPFKGLLPNTSMNGGKIALSQLLMQFPQFTTVTEQGESAGSSYYQGMTVEVNKRYSSGLSLISSFGWNHLFGRYAYLNPSDPTPEETISLDSVPLRAVIAATYHLPVGHGELVNLESRWADALIGGWRLGGIYSWNSGPPLTWGNVIYNGGDIQLHNRETNGPSFDTTRFNTVPSQQLLDNIRTFPTMFNKWRSDGTNNLDLSILKQFHFTEATYFQLRLDAFNSLNHPMFAAPNLTPTSSSFGLITGITHNPRAVQLAGRIVW